MALELVDPASDFAVPTTDWAIRFPDGWDTQRPFLRVVAQSRS